jgi:hypothetical protein
MALRMLSAWSAHDRGPARTPAWLPLASREFAEDEPPAAVGGDDQAAARSNVVTSEPDPNRYSEALEQQWALVRDIMAPGGHWLAGVDREKIAQLGQGNRGARDLAGFVAAHIAHAEPFFWSASIARAIVEAARTLPTYTFTAESFPCPKAFVWFEEPIELQPEQPELAPLRALAWSMLAHRHDPEGVPVLVYAFAAAEPRRAGLPLVQTTLRLGWTVEQHVAHHAAGLPTEPGVGSVDERLALSMACGQAWPPPRRLGVSPNARS